MAEGGEAVGSWGGPRCRGSAGGGAEPGVPGAGPARHGGGTRALFEPPAPPTGASGAAPPLASRPPHRPQLRFPEQSLPFPASERQAASPREAILATIHDFFFKANSSKRERRTISFQISYDKATGGSLVVGDQVVERKSFFYDGPVPEIQM
eukprot:bmy_17126T0